MGLGRGIRIWSLTGIAAVAACTAVANGRLDGLPAEGEGVGGTGSTSTDGAGGEGNTSRPSLLPVGTGCDESDPGACASGFCVDGVCCDQKCDGECLACDLFNQNGVCQALVGEACGSDLQSACNAEGQCVTVDDGDCMNDMQCSTGHCVDGRCCNEACDGPCQTCRDHSGEQSNIPDGICAYEASADDQCNGATCVGKGQCCGEAQPATGNGMNDCPTACSGGCSADTCIIACGANECKGVNIVCPPGLNCEVRCIDHHACQDSFVDCPAGHACDLVCDNTNDKNHACERVVFNCSNGPCSTTCLGNNPCIDTVVNCGDNACDVTCMLDDGEFPSVNCGTSCGCTNTCL